MVNGIYLLEKFEGKGGWTYALIPEITQNPNNPFGWVTVSGKIDSFTLERYKLMPMGNGQLFLPVKAEIRKKIKKQAGDYVQIQLEIDETPQELTDELIVCFQYESPELLVKFQNLPNSTQKKHIDYIYAAKSEETKANRIAELMRELSK